MNRGAALVGTVVLTIGLSAPRVWPEGGGVAAAVLVALGLVLVVLSLGLGRRLIRGESAEERRLRSHGWLGRGTVLELRHTGRRKAGRREVDLVLEVLVPGRRRYSVERTDWLDERREREVRVGRSVPVVVDPKRPGHVVLALELSDVDAAAIAALGPIAGGPGGPPTPRTATPPTPRGREGDR